MNEKRMVGEKAAEFVKDGMVVGIGTGSTIFYTIAKLGEFVQQGLSIKGVATSIQTERLARQHGIPIVTFSEIDGIDLALDGADEVNDHFDLIKGGGGALLREKIIAHAANTFIVVADSSKKVKTLGAFGLPVEVVPFGFEMTAKHIHALGGNPRLRREKGIPYNTDNGNYILDCDFKEISDPEKLEQSLNMIPGVVENGLFVRMADKVITLNENKEIILKERKSENGM
ncbi:ribose-5-phosphate isomerase RpiA [Bacillus sp. V5-8f]|uniref:ribose-5-phosphate isomerase RpiA n=1 Tax=Bacillus sp. V5-8f TaxID=2053044 RepID=UPI000C75905E|nr:ribose-5-phosphate isomerase RpiA [Bacillus sp. V5-8f]PLT33099.1 ribose 5-phosphate isomerase A [Bacillus sp. V5-8f]